MNTYLTGQEAITDLHRRGFTCDFHLAGNDLFWVQQQQFVRAGDFSILECHEFRNVLSGEPDLVVFGIRSVSQEISGILIGHYASYGNEPPPVITKKMREMIITGTGNYEQHTCIWQ